eukprot:1286578-Alexandrium_andersonii.AAC.1
MGGHYHIAWERLACHHLATCTWRGGGGGGSGAPQPAARARGDARYGLSGPRSQGQGGARRGHGGWRGGQWACATRAFGHAWRALSRQALQRSIVFARGLLTTGASHVWGSRFPVGLPG